MAIPDEIKKIMHTLCINQKEFSKMIGMKPDSISKYLRGDRKPSCEAIRRFVEFAKKNKIHLTYNDFFKHKDEKKDEQTTKAGSA